MIDKNKLANIGRISAFGLVGLLSGCYVGGVGRGPNGPYFVGTDVSGPLMAEAEQHNRQMQMLHGNNTAQNNNPPPQPQVVNNSPPYGLAPVTDKNSKYIVNKAVTEGIFYSLWVDRNNNGRVDLDQDVFFETNIFYPGDKIFFMWSTYPSIPNHLGFVNEENTRMSVTRDISCPVGADNITTYNITSPEDLAAGENHRGVITEFISLFKQNADLPYFSKSFKINYDKKRE